MLKDSEWLALARLLDDEDPEVRNIAYTRLSEAGRDHLHRIEALADEIGDMTVRHALLDLKEKIITDTVMHTLLKWRQGGGENLAEGWMAISPLLPKETDMAKMQGEITRLTNKLWLELNDQMKLGDKLRVFNHVFFILEGYHLQKDNPQAPGLCFLNELLNTKAGNAQSLCLLYLIVATRLELPVGGVVIPGYSVLYCFDEHQPFYLDVANGGNFISREGIEVFIKKLGLQEQSSWYKPTTNIRLVLNLLEVLRQSYYAKGLPGQAQRVEQILEGIDIRFE